MDKLCSDVSQIVIFHVGPDKAVVKATKDKLTSQSCVFRAMLCGPLAEKGEIMIPDTVEDIFTQFIRYLETGHGHIDEPAENIADMLYLAKKYSVKTLEEICLDFLKTNLCMDTASDILRLGYTFDGEELLTKATEIVIKDISDGNVPFGFTDLPMGIFQLVIKSRLFDEYPSHPVGIVANVSAWAEAECSRQGLDVTKENKQSVLGEEYVPEMIKVSFPGKPYGWLFSSCNMDILLHGFTCPGLQGPTVLHVELFTTRSRKNVYLLQTDIKVETHTDDDSANVPFSKPMFLSKNTKYSLQVLLKNGSPPPRFTAASREPFIYQVDNYKFTVSKAPLEGMQKLICGLIFSDYELWTTNRDRCLLACPVLHRGQQME